ncbi:hypothetical protein ElyMa_000681900 [Elysia marginata]|uniref:Uncharacterized protein n=1 Tax=Elysia marginata TaxID=1093978 RepID=A0AAV4GKB8_9GAST|nr:hypothetical protein ElyMa_000681900 [Elysia marginata]
MPHGIFLVNIVPTHRFPCSQRFLTRSAGFLSHAAAAAAGFACMMPRPVSTRVSSLCLQKRYKQGDRSPQPWSDASFTELLRGQRGRVVSASDSRPGGRGFDSRPCHVLGKAIYPNFPQSTHLQNGYLATGNS